MRCPWFGQTLPPAPGSVGLQSSPTQQQFLFCTCNHQFQIREETKVSHTHQHNSFYCCQLFCNAQHAAFCHFILQTQPDTQVVKSQTKPGKVSKLRRVSRCSHLNSTKTLRLYSQLQGFKLIQSSGRARHMAACQYFMK